MKTGPVSFSSVALAMFLLVCQSQAQTVGINMNGGANGTTGNPGRGPLGAGTVWNNIENSDTAIRNSVLDLKDQYGVATTWDVYDESSVFVNTCRDIDAPNNIQQWAWGTLGTWPQIRIADLTPNTAYQLALYTFRRPVAGTAAAYTVNGVAKIGLKTDADYIVLPGLANYDYLLFTVNSGPTGEVTIVGNNACLCGIQIEPYVPSGSSPAEIRKKIRKLTAKIARLKKRKPLTLSKRLAIRRLKKKNPETESTFVKGKRG